jgi:hypothetical protein
VWPGCYLPNTYPFRSSEGLKTSLELGTEEGTEGSKLGSGSTTRDKASYSKPESPSSVHLQAHRQPAWLMGRGDGSQMCPGALNGFSDCILLWIPPLSGPGCSPGLCFPFIPEWYHPGGGQLLTPKLTSPFQMSHTELSVSLTASPFQ